MNRCKECGREINDGQKRCSYCNSNILSLSVKKIFNKTMETSNTALSKTVKVSSHIRTRSAEKIKDLQEKQQEKSLKKKKEKIQKLQKQIEKKSMID